MSEFILNRNVQENGDYEVHNVTAGCLYMPFEQNQIPLGSHLTCSGAITRAKNNYPHHRINGCYYCCNACHTR